MGESDTPTGDPFIRATEERAQQVEGGRKARAANLFDLRRIIGGLFVLYGALLTIMGLFDSSAEVAKAAGVRINLWAGLGMLVLGGLFLLWAFTRPLSEQLDSTEFGGGPRGDGHSAVEDPGAGR
jgi:hypothetical protein